MLLSLAGIWKGCLDDGFVRCLWDISWERIFFFQADKKRAVKSQRRGYSLSSGPVAGKAGQGSQDCRRMGWEGAFLPLHPILAHHSPFPCFIFSCVNRLEDYDNGVRRWCKFQSYPGLSPYHHQDSTFVCLWLRSVYGKLPYFTKFPF